MDSQRNSESLTDAARPRDDDDPIFDTTIYDKIGEDFEDRQYGVAMPNEAQLNAPDKWRQKRTASELPRHEELRNSKRIRLDGSDDQRHRHLLQGPHHNTASTLPAEAWSHIFTFVPPRTLGSLLLVNRQFNSYLDPSSRFRSASITTSPATGAVQRLMPDAIWRASRRLFWPRMPAALKGRSELEMWRICCTRICEFCKFHAQVATNNSENQQKRGPGAKGVSPIFPFFIASCGRCLSEKSVKEIDLLLNSSIPSALLPGLPMVFLTQESHAVPPHVLATGSPLQDRPIKVFWDEQIEKIKAGFEDARNFGSAAAEEWIKGLGPRGKRSLADSGRWERWYHAGGVEEMRTSDSGAHTRFVLNRQELPTTVAPNPVGLAKATKGLMEPRQTTTDANYENSQASLMQLDPGAVTTGLLGQQQAPLLQSTRATSSDETMMSDSTSSLTGEKAHTEDRASQAGCRPAVQGVAAMSPDGVSRSVKVTDEDWNQAQGALRGQIAGFADEAISYGWNQGHKLTKKNVPQFAADVLLYVRKKFYAGVAKNANTLAKSGTKPAMEPPEGPWTQKLTLGNLKWVFDVKIKPHTDQLRKDIFLCNDCTGSNKLYGMPDVVQHYAAKHTKALSLGSSVVYWRAEWPETPIFKPNPQGHLKNQPRTKKNVEVIRLPPIPGLSTTPDCVDQATDQSKTEGGRFASIPGLISSANSESSSHHLPYFNLSQYERHLAAVEPYSSYDAKDSSQSLEDANSLDNRGQKTSMRAQEALVRLEYTIKVMRQTWQKLAIVKGLDDAVKICVVIHHMAEGFQRKFSEAAPLQLFIEALRDPKFNPQLSHLAGLSCKACQLSSLPSPKSKMYSLAKLLRHFKVNHGENAAQRVEKRLDWRVDMIWLPPMSALMTLRAVIGKDKEALQAVSDALPWAFETPYHKYNAKTDDRTLDFTADHDPATAWQQPPRAVREDFGRRYEHAAAPSLELDGFEFVDEPSMLSSWKQVGHCTSSNYEQKRSKIPQAGLPTDGLYSAPWSSSWTHDHQSNHGHDPRHAYYPVHPSYERHPVESYQRVEVRDPRGDPRGDNLPQRSLRRSPPGDVYYRNHGQPYAVSCGTHYHNRSVDSHVHVHGAASASSYEEYDPRFPAAGGAGFSHRERRVHAAL